VRQRLRQPHREGSQMSRIFENFLVVVLVTIAATMIVIPLARSVAQAMDRSANLIAEASNG
jgi:hypothetical protein